MDCNKCEKCVKHCYWCENHSGELCYLEFTTADARTCDKYIPAMEEGVCILEEEV